MKRFPTKTITVIAMLTAIEIILSRFLSISAWNIKIGFSFIPVVLAAMLFGPLAAGLVGGLGDLLGAMLFPIGPFFPGFTVTAFLMGMVFGLFLHKKQTFGMIAAAVGINQLILSLLLNTYWISLLYGAPYTGLLSTRVIQTGILLVVQILVIRGMVQLPWQMLRGETA